MIPGVRNKSLPAIRIERNEALVFSNGSNAIKARYYHLEAFMAMNAGEYQRAIEILSGSLDLAVRRLRPRGEYYLALAYLGAGQPKQAIPLLKRQVSTMESIFNCIPTYAVKAHYLLGLACEQTGRTTEAIKRYQEFLNTWQNADPGLAEIADARKRLERLQQVS